MGAGRNHWRKITGDIITETKKGYPKFQITDYGMRVLRVIYVWELGEEAPIVENGGMGGSPPHENYIIQITP